MPQITCGDTSDVQWSRTTNTAKQGLPRRVVSGHCAKSQLRREHSRQRSRLSANIKRPPESGTNDLLTVVCQLMLTVNVSLAEKHHSGKPI